MNEELKDMIREVSDENQDRSKLIKSMQDVDSIALMLESFPIEERLEIWAEIEPEKRLSVLLSLRHDPRETIIDAIEYGTGDAKYQAHQKFFLDENHLACIINGTESWFKNQSLLIFDKENKSFKDAMILSQFYGGDGGQIVTESWIYTENGKKHLYQIESSHFSLLTPWRLQGWYLLSLRN